MVKISPSILSANFACLREEIEKVKEAEWIHVDVMDGHFVPNLTIGPLVVRALRKITKQFLDVHLMIENPEKYVKAFAEAGADLITVHIEACGSPEEVVKLIKESGCKAGVSVKPGTGVEEIEGLLDKIDLVLVMSVEPGFGGQKFMPEVLPKVERLKKLKEEKGLEYEIEVDGGINRENCSDVVKAGADILVSGSAIFRSDNPAEEMRVIRERANKALK